MLDAFCASGGAVAAPCLFAWCSLCLGRRQGLGLIRLQLKAYMVLAEWRSSSSTIKPKAIRGLKSGVDILIVSGKCLLFLGCEMRSWFPFPAFLSSWQSCPATVWAAQRVSDGNVCALADMWRQVSFGGFFLRAFFTLFNARDNQRSILVEGTGRHGQRESW